MDTIDFKILSILQNKARIPNVEVARAIGMAPSAVLERIKKLEAQGIIDGYEVRLNPEQFHRSTIAFIRVRMKSPSMIRSAGESLAQLEEIQEVHFLSGEDCLMAKVRVADTRELDLFIREKITEIPGITHTTTSVALSTYKETARIPLIETPEHEG